MRSPPGDIVPPAGVTVHNPDMHIATLNDKGKLEVELVVERGRGYVPAVQNKGLRRRDRPYPGRFHLLAGAPGDLQVEATRVEQRTDFDKLILDVETKNSISPRDAWRRPARPWSELFGLARELNDRGRGHRDRAVAGRGRPSRRSRCRSTTWT